MSERKRRWFQIHLSTAVVMMFAASGLLYLNLIYINSVNGTVPPRVEYFEYEWGWPFPSMSHINVADDMVVSMGRAEGMLFNPPLNISILLLSGYLSELLIRKARRP